jgi:hypothetical protein
MHIVYMYIYICMWVCMCIVVYVLRYVCVHQDFLWLLDIWDDVTANGRSQKQLDKFCHILNESAYNFCHSHGFCS